MAGRPDGAAPGQSACCYSVAVSLRSLAALLALMVCGCTPHACNEEGDRQIRTEVEFLVGEAGPLADRAHVRLVERGSDAIPILETGLYQGDAAGRRRVIEVLSDIGSAAARPILEHVERRDPDPAVRAAASRALAQLPGAK